MQLKSRVNKLSTALGSGWEEAQVIGSPLNTKNSPILQVTEKNWEPKNAGLKTMLLMTSPDFLSNTTINLSEILLELDVDAK